MIKGFTILLLAGLIARGVNQDPVILSGTTTDCEGGQAVNVRHIAVRALNPATNQNLVNLLRTLDTVTWVGDGVESMRRFEPMYRQMVGLLRNATTLAQDTTTETGAFTLSVPSSDSVVVVAQADLEDEPTYYGFRMVGARSNATFEIDMSLGECAPQGTIQRTAAGLIFQDDFDRANGAPGSNWDIQGNAAFWSIAGNVLKAKPTNATLQQILVANSVFGTGRGEMVVQARMRRVGTNRTTFPFIQVRATGTTTRYQWGLNNTSGGTRDEFTRVLNGAATALLQVGDYNANNLWQQFKLAIKDSEQKGWKDGMLQVNATDAALNAVTGRAGLLTGWYTATADYHEYDDFAVYKKNSVTIGGLPAGYMLRVGTRFGNESGGSATVDLADALCPQLAVEVVNTSGSVVARYTPTGGVWGGDTYSYAP